MSKTKVMTGIAICAALLVAPIASAEPHGAHTAEGVASSPMQFVERLDHGILAWSREVAGDLGRMISLPFRSDASSDQPTAEEPLSAATCDAACTAFGASIDPDG